jgi:aminoglycoside phosphotransferase (APT) family kinase protein
MTEVNTVVDTGRLTSWLDSQGLEPGRELATRVLTGGRSNVMYLLDRGDQHWVLRRPAKVAVERADTGMVREYQILRALEGSEVPHPGVVALCEDPTVMDRTFYLMERMPGSNPLPLRRELDNVEGRRAVVDAVVGALAMLHEFDWRAAGLEHLGRPEGFHERQVERWTRQLHSYGGRELPGFADISRWLEAHLPATFTPTLMHGDYHMMNVLMSTSGPPAVTAILDWETSTIGDPLLDLAGFYETWSRNDEPGWPSSGEMVERYFAARCMPKVADLTYYEVLYHFRLAVLLEGIFQRAQHDPTRTNQSDMGAQALANIDRAAALVAGS